MYTIVEACEKHSADLVEFQVKMAEETEGFKLDQKLVRDAIDYLAHHPSYGQFYVTEYGEEKQPCASLLMTYENQSNWWIQSVYVRPEHRRKGNFTNLFKNLMVKAQQRDVKSIKLYAEKDNDKAKAAYRKLGMHANGQLFYGLDLVYGSEQEQEKLKMPCPEGFSIQKSAPLNAHHQFKWSLGRQCSENQGIVCLHDGVPCGYCEFFSEFSEWRFGLTLYIKFLQLDQKHPDQVIESFKKYIFQKCEFKVGAIRFIVTEEELGIMKELDPNLHLEGYEVMAINLDTLIGTK